MAGARTPWQSLATATIVGGVILATFIWLGFLARPPQQKSTPEIPAKTLPYSKIICNPPPGKTLQDFLRELRYYDLPETITIDADADRTLRNTLLRHELVEKVTSIKIDPDKPTIEIELQFKRSD
jgi:hypothetical protein